MSTKYEHENDSQDVMGYSLSSRILGLGCLLNDVEIIVAHKPRQHEIAVTLEVEV